MAILRNVSYRALTGGAVAGLVGGAVLLLLSVLTASVMGQDPWLAIKLPSVPWLGDAALQPGFAGGPVAFGLFVHAVVSAAWGLGFAAVFSGAPFGLTLGAGPFFGFAVWIVMHMVVLEAAGLGRYTDGTPVGLSVLLHLVYGLATAVGFLPFQVPSHGVSRREQIFTTH